MKYLGLFNLILFFHLKLFAISNISDLNATDKLPPQYRDEAQFILNQYLEAQKNPDFNLNLDLDDQVQQSVFSKPGFFTSEECITKKSKCSILGQFDNKTKFKPTGKIEFKLSKPNDDDDEPSLYTYAEIEYSEVIDGQSRAVKGWIPQDNISFTPIIPSYAQVAIEKIAALKNWIFGKDEKPVPCEQSSKAQFSNPAATNNLKDIAEVSKAITKNIDVVNKERKTISEIVDMIAPSIGKCALRPPNQAPKNFTSAIAYDQYALPLIKSAHVPKGLTKENNQPVQNKDLVEIDIFARTIFAEMASCTPIGAQYPMAVARVIMNRDLAMQSNPAYKSEFINSESAHDSSKSLMSKAASSPVQFSAWNQNIIDFDALAEARDQRALQILKTAKSKKMSAAQAEAQAKKELKPDSQTKKFYKKNDSGLLHTLCPPSDKNSPCYTGAPPGGNLNAVWQNTLKVATEAVLFRKQFLEKTPALDNIKHYTSNRDKFLNYKLVKPSIEGRKIDSKRCLNLWRPKTKAEIEEERLAVVKAATKKAKKSKK